VEVKDRLTRSRPDVGHDLVVLETGDARCLGDELEHALRLVGGKAAHVAKRVDVALGDHEEVRIRLRIDVADRREAVRAM
jgi:hypothetical protein